MKKNNKIFMPSVGGPLLAFRIILILCCIFSLTVATAQQVSVTATSGTLSASYSTLKQAFDAINLGTHQGSIAIDISASTNEGTTPAVLNASVSPANYTQIYIRPVADNVVISGGATPASRGTIELFGADNVTIDGDNPNTSGTNRNLTITQTGALGGVLIWIKTLSVTDGCTGNTVKNCLLTGGNTAFIAAILSGSGVTFGSAANVANSNNTIQNNAISQCQNGLFLSGFATSPYDVGWNVTGNTISNTTFRGMLIGGASAFNISNNTISNVTSTATSTSNMSGIQVTANILNGNIYGNKISNIKQINTGGYGAEGITLGAATTASNLTVYNNFIWDVAGKGFSTFTVSDNGNGIAITAGGGYNLYYNSVYMGTEQTAATGHPTCLLVNTVATNNTLNIRNNIFVNACTVGATFYCVYSAATAARYLDINYNDYFVLNGTAIGFLTSARANLAAWQTATGKDANSQQVNPQFNSTSDLHLQALSTLVTLGTPIAGITTDIDNDTRSGSTPSIGADEFIPVPCSGTPSPGNTITTSYTPCSTANFTLSLQFVTPGTGVTYQWQSTPTGTGYTNIGGATSSSYTTTQSGTNYYQCVVTCSGSPGTSAPVKIVSPTACHCTPAANSNGTCNFMWITNVTFGTINNTSGCSSPMANYSGLITSLTTGAGTNMSFTSNVYPLNYVVWIDMNDDGTFASTEKMMILNNPSNLLTIAGSLAVPPTANLGIHRMRIRGDYNLAVTPSDPCGSILYGETEDYSVNIVAPPPCSGTPTSGTTVSSVNPVCSGSPFTLSLTGASNNTGLTYQWQSAPDVAGSPGTWTNISGATSYTLTTSQTVLTHYRAILDCSGQTSLPSAELLVTMNTFAGCLCTSPNYSGSGCTIGLYVDNVTFAGINNTSGCNAVAPYFSDFTAQFANVTQTFTYPVSISAVPYTAANYFQFFKLYIDYNDNGVFDDAGELVFNPGNVGTVVNLASGNVTIPANAPIGTHRMRVRSANADVNSCTDNGVDGEVEDYSVTISAPPVCSGNPTPGNTLLSSENLACNSDSYTLSLQNATSGTGVTYQWQSAPDVAGVPGTWTDISGATSQTATTSETATTWYRCNVTCSASTTVASNPVAVYFTAACVCHSPNYSAGASCSIGIYTDNFSFAGINNTASGCNSTPPYSHYFNLIGTGTRGISYPISISTPPYTPVNYNQYFKVYIDYNDNGSFEDAGELIFDAGNVGVTVNSATGNYTIPVNAPLGIHILRVRDANGDVNSCSLNGVSGEVEDYSIEIKIPVCLVNPTSPANGGNACALPGGNTVTWPSLSGATGYDVYFGTNQTLVANSDNSVHVVSNQNVLSYITPVLAENTTYYWAVVPVITGSSGTCSVWSFTTFFNPTPNITVDFPGNALCEGGYLNLLGDNFTPNQGSGNSWEWYKAPNLNTILNTQPVYPLAVNSSSANNGDYYLTVTNQQGCTATVSQNVTVLLNPVVSNATGSPTNVSCFGLSTGAVDLDATSGSPGYLFDFVDQFSVPVAAPNSSGVFGGLSVAAGPYTATATDQEGCVSAPLVVTITEPPVLTVGAGSNTPVCTGTSLNLNATPGGGTSGYSYVWTGPNGPIPSVQNPTIASATVSDAGNYSVQVTDAHLCTAVSANHLVQVNASPTAAISLVGSPNKCLGQTATVSLTFTGTGPWNYTVSGSGGPYTGSASGNTNINVTPTATGTQTYTVTSVGNASCPSGGTATGSAIVYVSTIPPPSSGPIPVGPAEACANSVILITTNVVAGQNIRYSWNTGSNSSTVLFSTNIGGPFSPGPFQTTANQVYAQFGALGGGQSGYHVCMQSVNGCGSSINKCLWLRGTVNGPGPITPTDGVVACPGTSQVYSCGLSGGASVYTWTLNGLTTAITPNGGNNPTNVSVAFPSGFTTGQLCVTAALSCGATSAPRCITVNKNPANPNVPTGAATVCPGAPGVPYSIPAVPGASGYSWTVPANATIATGLNSPSITVNFPTPFTGSSSVCVTTTSSCGASVVKCKTVVSGIPNQPAGITGPLTNVCASTVQYVVVAPIGGLTYTWTYPAGTTLTGQGSTPVQVAFPSNFTSGVLTVTATSATCPSTPSAARTSSTIWGRPNNAGAITQYPPGPFCPGDGLNFSVVNQTPAATYTWTSSNGSITAGQGSNNIDVTWGTNNAPGTITVRAGNGCGLSAGTNSQVFTAVICSREEGINASSETTFSVYPNPAHDRITVSIDVKEQTGFNLKLRDMSGRIILSEDLQAEAGLNAYNMDLKGFAKGIYMLEVQSADKSWKTKVVVE